MIDLSLLLCPLRARVSAPATAAVGMLLAWGPCVAGTVIPLQPLEYRGAIDNGPQDGTFDEFVPPPNDEIVNNNGYVDYRGGMEFELPALDGQSIVQAILTLNIEVFEGQRSFAVHGFSGDGVVQLGDFALDGLIEERILSWDGNQFQLQPFDVTSFVQALADDGAEFAGFNLREEPPNRENYVVMRVRLDPGLAPTLTLTAESVCGDGAVGPGEQCDDGNTDPGDGCDELCQFEVSEGIPTVSEPVLMVLALLVIASGAIIFSRRL